MASFTPSAAFFDLDRTLIRGSANFPLAVAAFKAGFVPKLQLTKDIVNAVIFIVAGASDERSVALRERILKAVAGAPVEELVTLGADFIPRLAETVMPESQIELDRQRQEGRDRIIVSASPIEIVDAIADQLGLEGAVGTRAEVEDGRYTGVLAGPFCYGDGKALAVRALAEERGYDLASSVAYSDSVSDLPFLECVGTPVAINADRHLRKIALDRGWRIVETRDDTARVADAAMAVQRSGKELVDALASLTLARAGRIQSGFSDRGAAAMSTMDSAISSARERVAHGLSVLAFGAQHMTGKPMAS